MVDNNRISDASNGPNSGQRPTNRMNRKLIVTADDYGMCDSVNEAIEECMRQERKGNFETG